MKKTESGKLYVVATPIGNLQDMSFRAVEVLKSVDKIIAEDTRHALPLLKNYSITKPLQSMHEFNERTRVDMVIAMLQQGESLALITDAGTPLISDPGYHLIKKAKEVNIEVIPVPGACALITALSAAGLPTDKFIFEGFLPPKSEMRRNRLAKLLHESRTMIFYEAPHRLLACLQTLLEVFGEEREVVVAREMTKVHESILKDKLINVLNHYEKNPQQQKGEIVILLAGEEEKEAVTKEVNPEEVLDLLLSELSLKQAVTLASKITKVNKNELYELALSKKA